jgi:hypothetical protein
MNRENLLHLLQRQRPRPSREAGRPPAYSAVLVQLLATASALAQALWFADFTGVALSPWQWAALQGCIAWVLAAFLDAAWWWRAIHLLFAPALVLGLALDVPPLLCFATWLALIGVYWGSHRSQVPLYLSGAPAWQAVAALLPQCAGAKIIDLGSGLGGLTAHLGHLRADLRVDGVEGAPLPWLASRIRQWCHGWNGTLVWGDLWRVDLAQYDLVHAYLSPVPMPELWSKAIAEMRSGSVLVSHSFAVPGVAPSQVVELPGDKRLFVYRIGE